MLEPMRILKIFSLDQALTSHPPSCQALGNQTREQTAELEKRVQEALDEVEADTYKTLYEAAMKLHLSIRHIISTRQGN